MMTRGSRSWFRDEKISPVTACETAMETAVCVSKMRDEPQVRRPR